MGIKRLGAIGAFILASLVGYYSSSTGEASAPMSQPVATQKAEENKKLFFKQFPLVRSRIYKAMALCTRFEGDKQYFGMVVTDLRSVGNIAHNMEEMLDRFSYSSMIQRGTAGGTILYLTEVIKNSALEAELEKRISPNIERRIAREDYPAEESEAESVRIANIGPDLLPKEPPQGVYFFQEPTLSPLKVLPVPSAKETLEVKSRRKNEPSTCPPRPKDKEEEIYKTMQVVPMIIPDKENPPKYSCAGLGIKLTEKSRGYDLVAVFDLRGLEKSDLNINPINLYDVQALAFRGNVPTTVYCTSEAKKQIEESPFLRANRLETAFSRFKDISVQVVDQSLKKALRSGELERFLPETQPETIYFHPPRIFLLS